MTDLAERRGVETRVYGPAEDSELLLGAAREAVDGSPRVLEVGTGSGYVAVELAAAGDARVVASDLNPHACRVARERARETGVALPVVRGNLTHPFRPDGFDLVLFNPPYLPRDPDAEREDPMEYALTGGEDGRAVIEPFLDDVGRVLAPGGRVLLVVSSLTDIGAVAAYAAEHGLAARTVREESFPFERLAVLELRLAA